MPIFFNRVTIRVLFPDVLNLKRMKPVYAREAQAQYVIARTNL